MGKGESIILLIICLLNALPFSYTQHKLHESQSALQKMLSA